MITEDKDIVSASRETLEKFIRELHSVTNYVKISTMSMNVLYTEESIEEINKMFDSKEFYITPDGEITFTSAQGVNELVIAHMTA